MFSLYPSVPTNSSAKSMRAIICNNQTSKNKGSNNNDNDNKKTPPPTTSKTNKSNPNPTAAPPLAKDPPQSMYNNSGRYALLGAEMLSSTVAPAEPTRNLRKCPHPQQKINPFSNKW